MRSARRLDITVIGDSTIDNKVWISRELSELSVIQHFQNLMPGCNIHDYSNDGFTTGDCLRGAYRDKAFGFGMLDMFTETVFSPLVEGAASIENSDYVILSVGGNNLREFIQEAFLIQDDAARKLFMQNNFDNMIRTLQSEYVEIVCKIRKLNPDANIVLMTQYYPSAVQNNYRIYQFMCELGLALNLGKDSTDVIQQLLIKIYRGIFDNLDKNNILVADLTSSLDPFDEKNHVSQIEPSGEGGRKIAALLAHLIKAGDHAMGQVYRKTAGYGASSVETVEFDQWQPRHPSEFLAMACFGGVAMVTSGVGLFAEGALGARNRVKLDLAEHGASSPRLK